MFRTSLVHHQERFVQAVCADLVCGNTSTTRIATYQICTYSLYKTLLMMDQWGPKHVKLTYVMNKTQSLKNFVYLVELHIYYYPNLPTLKPEVRNVLKCIEINTEIYDVTSLCTATFIATYKHQQMHAVYLKSQIIRTRELSYMFQL